jgi:putative ABC transport system permease protein
MMDVAAHADLALAAALLLINGIISVTFGLRLERRLVIAAVRMVVQLAVLGLLLKFVFAQTSPLWTLLVAAIMVAFASIELAQQQDARLKRWIAYGLGNATLLAAGCLTTLYAVVVLHGPDRWHAPRYVLPILGMVLGNVLTSVSLALRTLADAVDQERAAIDARLALGATRFAAFAGVLRRSLRTATAPVLNTLAMAGVATMPGMMAGQILAGTDPADAARYQIMILFVLAGASALGASMAVLGSVLLMTDARHRLRPDRFLRRARRTS